MGYGKAVRDIRDDDRACKGRRQAGNRSEPEYPAHDHRFFSRERRNGRHIVPTLCVLSEQSVALEHDREHRTVFMAHLAGSKVCHVPLAKELLLRREEARGRATIGAPTR